MTTSKTRTTELTKLEHKREKYRTRVFQMMIEIALIFAVPAFLVLWIGSWLQEDLNASDGGLIIALVCTFFASWIIVIWRIMRIDKKMRRIDRKIRELKKDKTPEKKAEEAVEEYGAPSEQV